MGFVGRQHDLFGGTEQGEVITPGLANLCHMLSRADECVIMIRSRNVERFPSSLENKGQLSTTSKIFEIAEVSLPSYTRP